MRASDHPIIVGSAAWQLNGVNIFAEHLVRGLTERSWKTHIYFTEQDTELVQLPKEMMPFPRDLKCINIQVRREDRWEKHWFEVLRYLSSQSPCIYLPNSDFRHSCVTPMLPAEVMVVGLIQGDDPIHYEHVHRLGAYWDAIVCVSEEIEAKVVAQDPDFRDRTHVIPNTVVVPPECPQRQRRRGDPLRIVYHGVLNTYQKRILHIPDILEELERRGVPFRMTIAGDGPQREELLSRCRRWADEGSFEYRGIVAHHDIDALLSSHDCYVMTSAFEGMPHAVLEAMSQGTVPVVTEIDSGIPEVITQGVSGYRVPVGDIGTFANRFEELWKDPELLARLSKEGHRAIQQSRFNTDWMVQAYERLFEEIARNREEGRFVRPKGTILPPPAVVNGLSIFPMETYDFVREARRAWDEWSAPSQEPSAKGKTILTRLKHALGWGS